MTLPICNSTRQILHEESVGLSLLTINTNFYKLDQGNCIIGEELQKLETFIKSLSAKDSLTIDKSFSANSYFLSADVKNNSIGTIKLGQDIPEPTKTFLRTTRLSNLSDTSITSPANEHVLNWDGTKWINRLVVDDIGARRLPELQDVNFNNPLQNNRVLEYNSQTQKWYNGPDSGLSAVPDGFYEDIEVKNNGINWQILSARVGTNELATAAVSTVQISNSTITNEKFANNTIQLTKCRFTVGETNTGFNSGTSGARFFKRKNNTNLEFRKFVITGNASYFFNNDSFVISQPVPPLLSPYIGQSLTNINEIGSKTNIFTTVTNVSSYNFRSLRAGTGGIVIQQTDNEVIISRPTRALSLSLFNSQADGSNMTVNEVAARIAAVYPPSSFSANTICTVFVQTPFVYSPTVTNVSIPFSSSYYHKVNTITWQVCIRGCKTFSDTSVVFGWTDPFAQEVASGWFYGVKNLNANVSFTGSNSFRATPSTQTYRNNGSAWVHISTTS
jgi:hypothetical protein